MAKRRSSRRTVRTGSRARWRLALIPAVLLAVLVLVFAVDAAVFAGRIHKGITIAGVDFGRLTSEQASDRLTGLIEEAAAEPIILVHEDYRWPVLPAEFGVEIDVHGTVQSAAAVTRSGNLFRKAYTRASLYFRTRNVPLEGSVDDERLSKIIDMVAEKLDQPPVDADLEFQGDDIVIIESKDGLVVDREALATTLREVLLSLHSTDVGIPMVVKSPNIRSADTTGAVEAARVMASAPLELRSGDQTWTMSVDTIKLCLDFTVAGTGASAHLVPSVSAEKAADFLAPVAETVHIAAKRATWETDGSVATLIPAVVGKELNYEKTCAALTAAASRSTERTAEAVLREIQPERTTEQAKAMGIEKSIGSYTTEFTGSPNRISNIQRAAELISSTLLAPGEVFSFNQTVGERTEARGFKTAPVIKEDGRLEDDLGGGICQVATTLFNAAFFAGLEIVERTNHLLYIDHYPMGRDATVSWGSPDLKFRNDTDHWILIKAYADENSATFVLYGTPDGRKVTYTTSDWYDIVKRTEKRVKTDELFVGETRVKDPGQDGRSCYVTRTVTRDGKVIRKGTFYSVYPMVPKVIEEGTKPKETTTTTQTTTTTTRPTTSTSKPSTTTTRPSSTSGP